MEVETRVRGEANGDICFNLVCTSYKCPLI